MESVMNRTTREQSRLAIQAAGHAVAGLAIGLSVKKLSIHPENGLDARIKFNEGSGSLSDDDWLMIALSGAAAESKWTNLDKSANLERLAFDGGDNIAQQLKKFPESKRAEKLQRATSKAKKLVAYNFHLVERFRTELKNSSEVSSYTLGRILKHNKIYS